MRISDVEALTLADIRARVDVDAAIARYRDKRGHVRRPAGQALGWRQP